MLELDAIDKALLDGDFGPGAAHAMALLVRYGNAMRAERFVSIRSAHIDGCLYHGPSSIDFVQRFATLGARVRVPTTLNVAAIDTLHPEWYADADALRAAQLRLNTLHVEVGCTPTLTCAPYLRLPRPRCGEHVAWAESNAIVFVNSVLGARTDRYGDFTDLCAALTGRVPLAGLHRDENRRARVQFDVVAPERAALPRDTYFAALGYVLGRQSAGRVPLLTGLPADTTEDELKSLGSAAASSGAMALFHVLGITPEAATIELASGGEALVRGEPIGTAELAAAAVALCPLQVGEPLAAMCLGTPHFSRTEFAALARAVTGLSPAPGVKSYVSTSRAIAAEIQASAEGASLAAFGVHIVVDTCTYVTPGLRMSAGAIVTTSAKYAHYGPTSLQRRVGLMSLERCVRSVVAGRVVAP